MVRRPRISLPHLKTDLKGLIRPEHLQTDRDHRNPFSVKDSQPSISTDRA